MRQRVLLQRHVPLRPPDGRVPVPRGLVGPQLQQPVRLQHVALRAAERPLPVPRAHVRRALRALLPVLSRPLPPGGRHVRLRARLPRQVLPGAVPCRPLRPGLPAPVSVSPRPGGGGGGGGRGRVGQPKGTGMATGMRRLRAPPSLPPLLQMRPMQGPAAMHGGRGPLPDLRARLEWHQVRPAVRHWLLRRGLWPALPALSRRARLQSRHRQVHALQCGLDWRPVSGPCGNAPCLPRLPRCPPQRVLLPPFPLTPPPRLPRCETKCSNGTYGEDCAFVCVDCGSGHCDFQSGRCLCRPGVHGPQ